MMMTTRDVPESVKLKMQSLGAFFPDPAKAAAEVEKVRLEYQARKQEAYRDRLRAEGALCSKKRGPQGTSVCLRGHAKLPGQNCKECNRLSAARCRAKRKAA